jgi:tripartite ATP-independent transporter DctM subunit
MALLLGGFLVLMIVGIPVAFAMLAAALLYIVRAPGIGFNIVPQQLTDSLNSFPLIAVPLFIFAGALMGEAGVTQRLVELSRSLIGHIRAGLAYALVVAGMILAGISGSGTADAAALGSVMIPAMQQEKYDTGFAAALSACAGAIGPIIPPSIVLIIYGAMGNVSIGKLFLAGTVPGVLMGVFLMVTSYVVARRHGYGAPHPRAPLAVQWRAVRVGFLDLLLPVIIIGGIVGGIFTPSEAGAIAVAYVLIIGIFVYRTLTLARLMKASRESVIVLGATMLMIATAGIAQYLLALLQAADTVGAFFQAITTHPLVFLLLVNLLLLVLGCVMEVTAILVLMTPILVPILPKFGIDPVHFGVIMALNLAIGLLTPPVGLAMYVTCAIGGVSIERYTRACMPFLIGLGALLVAVTVFPSLVLALPRAFMG